MLKPIAEIVDLIPNLLIDNPSSLFRIIAHIQSYILGLYKQPDQHYYFFDVHEIKREDIEMFQSIQLMLKI